MHSSITILGLPKLPVLLSDSALSNPRCCFCLELPARSHILCHLFLHHISPADPPSPKGFWHIGIELETCKWKKHTFFALMLVSISSPLSAISPKFFGVGAYLLLVHHTMHTATNNKIIWMVGYKINKCWHKCVCVCVCIWDKSLWAAYSKKHTNIIKNLK